MEFREQVLDILARVTNSEEVKDEPNIPLFDEGLLDSMSTVELLVEIEKELGITVSVSEFDRDEWATPEMIIEKLEGLK